MFVSKVFVEFVVTSLVEHDEYHTSMITRLINEEWISGEVAPPLESKKKM